MELPMSRVLDDGNQLEDHLYLDGSYRLVLGYYLPSKSFYLSLVLVHLDNGRQLVLGHH